MLATRSHATVYLKLPRIKWGIAGTGGGWGGAARGRRPPSRIGRRGKAAARSNERKDVSASLEKAKFGTFLGTNVASKAMTPVFARRGARSADVSARGGEVWGGRNGARM